MDITQSEPVSVPTYIIYRDVQCGEPYDPAASPAFYPPKNSDELFDALRAKYPYLSTHSERMRNAVIEFLLEERKAAAVAAFAPDVPNTQSTSDLPMPWMDQSWQSTSSSSLSSPDKSFLATPAHMSSPKLNLSQSKENSPMPLDRMTSVFSLSTSSQPKQRLRRKMTEAEKAEYRQRRLIKACDKCAKRKRKCTHNQATGLSPPKSVKPSSRASVLQHETAVPNVGGQAFSPSESFHAEVEGGQESFNDFTLLFDEPLPEIDYGNMFDAFELPVSPKHFGCPPLFMPEARSPRTVSDASATTPDSLDGTLPYSQHYLGPLDDHGLPTHISPTLLDMGTHDDSRDDLHTPQKQAFHPYQHLGDLHDNAQVAFGRYQMSQSRPADTTNIEGTANEKPSSSSSQAEMSRRLLITGGSSPAPVYELALDEVDPDTSCSGSVSRLSPAPVASTSMASKDPGGINTMFPSQKSSLDVSSGRMESPSSSLFMARRRIAQLAPSDFAPLIQPRSSALQISTPHLDIRIAATAQLTRCFTATSLRSDGLPAHIIPTGQSLGTDSSTGSEQETLALQEHTLQHVGRLSDHVRYRDHHGRNASQTALQVLCSLLAIIWLGCFPVSLAVIAVSVMAWLGVSVCYERAASSKSASSLARVGRELTSAPHASVVI